MTVIVVLLLASLSVAVLFLTAFIWAVRSGQYEDTLTPSMRILADDVGDQTGDGLRGKQTEERGTNPA